MSDEENCVDWQALKEQGNAAFKQKNFEAAIALYSDAIVKKSDEPVLFSNRSACFLEMGDNDGAVKDALASLEIDNSFLRAYHRLHSALCNLGRFEEAAGKTKEGIEAVFRTATPADVRQLAEKVSAAEKADAALKRYEVLFQEGRLEDAAEVLRGPMKNFPNSHYLVFPFVESSANKNQDEAYKLLSGVKSTSSTDTDLNFLHGLVYYYRGQDGFAKAQTALRETLDWDPEHAKAKALLKKLRQIESHKEAGNAAFKKKDNKNAILEYTTAIGLDPTNIKMTATLRGNRGAAKMAEKDYHGALLDCNFAINNGLTSGKMFARRSRIKAELEQMEEALRDMQRAVELDSSFSAELRQVQARCRTAKKKNYYKALELSRNESDPKTIKKAYMKLCLRWHPDKWCDSSEEEKEIAEVQFKEVTEAYEVLSDPQKKYRYDNGLDDNTVGGGSGGGSPFGYSAGGNPFGGEFRQSSSFSFFGPMGQGSPFGSGRPRQSSGRYTDPRFSTASLLGVGAHQTPFLVAVEYYLLSTDAWSS